MQCFPIAQAINAWPRYHGPAIVQLPIQCPHIIRLSSSVCTDAFTYPIRLKELTYIHIIFIISRNWKVTRHIFFDQLKAAGVFLMGSKTGMIEINTILRCKVFYGFITREGLETKLTHKPGHFFLKMLKGITIMPYPPVVCIAFKLIPLITTSILRRTFPIRNRWAQTVYHFR